MVSEMVDRFTITAAEQDPGGQWVRYSDYAAIEAQLAETQEKLIEANDKLIRQNEARFRTDAGWRPAMNARE
jgi:hypothetical protein